MTLIVDVLNRVARRCKVAAPASWITATSLTYQEIRDDFLRETIEDLQKRVDWPQPISAQTVIAGDGSEDYALPSDFLRFSQGITGVYETTRTRRWGVPVSSDGAWTQLQNLGNAGTERYYRLKGYPGNYEISFYPNPGAGASITVSYMTGNWMATGDGTPGQAFTAADDVLLFERRPVELGTIWRWRADKGLDYEAEKREYDLWIATQANRLRGINTIHAAGGYDPGHPMRVPVPDFIPSG